MDIDTYNFICEYFNKVVVKERPVDFLGSFAWFSFLLRLFSIPVFFPRSQQTLHHILVLHL